MSPRVPAGLPTAVAPVREALLAHARAEGADALARAEAAAEQLVSGARDEAAAIRAEARAAGERDAAAIRARDVARARREARGAVLRAQSAAYEELRRRARESVRALREDPEYPVLVDALRARAVARLGSDAVVRELPEGGVLAEVPGRRLDLSLDALADAAVERLGGVVQQLWAP